MDMDIWPPTRAGRYPYPPLLEIPRRDSAAVDMDMLWRWNAIISTVLHARIGVQSRCVARGCCRQALWRARALQCTRVVAAVYACTQALHCTGFLRYTHCADVGVFARVVVHATDVYKC
eukprot:6510617-Pyramimonas_sp.AAC.1